MAGPWEKYQSGVPATNAAAGPWDKFKGKGAEEWERAVLLPMETNKETGERRLAWPQIAVDVGNAFMAPGRALQGEYGVEIDPATGRMTTITNDMIKDTLALSAIPALGGTGAVTADMALEATGGIPRAARSLINRAMKDDQVPVSEVVTRLEDLGPDAVLADLGPRLQKQAQAIATMPGAGQKTVLDVLTARAAGRNARVTTDVNETLGAAAVPSQVLSANRVNMEALRPEYEDAFRFARAVDTRPIAENLEAQAVNLRGAGQQAAIRIRQMLDIHGAEGNLDPNPRTLFETRNAIDGMMATETNPKAIGVLTEARRMIDEQLQAAVPGIKQVDAKFAELARQNEALGEGSMLLAAGKEARHPAEVVEQMMAGANPQGLGVGPSAVPFRLSQGTRAEIERLIGTKANDLQALRQAVGGEGDWNRAKLAAVFGADKADRLLAIISRELRYQALEQDALAGSRTQVLKAAQDEIAGTEPKTGFFQSVGNLQFGTAGARAADAGLGWAARSRRAATNSAVADALMSRNRENLSRQLLYGGPSLLGEMAPSATAKALVARGKAPWLSP